MSWRRCLPPLAVSLAMVLVPTAGAAQPGERDPTFAGGQPVFLDLAKGTPKSTFFGDVFVDAGGRVVAGGSTVDENGKNLVALARLTPAGAVDGGFGTNGSTTLQPGQGSGTNAPFSLLAGLFSLPGGGIGGGVYMSAADGRNQVGAVRLRDDGSPDLNFGTGGVGAAQPAGNPPAVTYTIGSGPGLDGSIFTAGTIDTNPAGSGTRKLVVTKFAPQGSVQAGFGNQNGSFVGSFAQDGSASGNQALAVLALPSGNILVAGITHGPDGRDAVLLLRRASRWFAPAPAGRGPVGQAKERNLVGGLSTARRWH